MTPEMKPNHPELLNQERFQAPKDWDWSFRTLKNIKIRYGQSRSRKDYRAVVVMFEGLGDFGEQYFELARNLDARDLKLIVIDLPGQGGSGRYLKNSHKRHSVNFSSVLEDLHTLIDEVALSAAVDPEDNHKRLPIILLAHSLGGHLALRYLAEYNKSSRCTPIFACAAMTAPMISMKSVEAFPKWLSPLIIRFLALCPQSYIPMGGDWVVGSKIRPYLDYVLSSDPERSNLQNAFFSNALHQKLVIGSPTNKWLSDAFDSCNIIQKPNYLEKITVPILIGLAEQDALVSNTAIRAAAKKLPHAELLEFPTAHHEILMETDDIRNKFLDRFFTFIDENVLMKPDNGKLYIQ